MISVIITVYNKGPWLKRCFDSVANQTDQSAQVIVVNDGSTDGGREICEEYRDKYGWDVFHTKNNGVSAARNLGIEGARGDYITFLDADDAYEPKAIETMLAMTNDEKYSIIQFGQYKVRKGAKSPHHISPRGDYDLPKCVDYWEFVTNKLYKRSFIMENNIRFIEGLQFGEDELFNTDAFLANHGLRQAAVLLYDHYFDDKKSLCRGGLNLDKLKVLDELMRERLVEVVKKGGEEWVDGAEFILWQMRRHYQSATFERFGFKQKPRGRYDIVYFVKNAPRNEELRYSLRSVEEYFRYRRLWFYGGCPTGLRPDHHVKVAQNMPSKWENVRKMMIEVCKNDDITENFWLFNDDFFILRPIDEGMEPRFDGTLTSKIQQIRDKHHGEDSEWSKNLGKLKQTLEKHGKPEKCYAIHEPMLINRRKMLEVLEKFPNEPMIRALYGNWWEIGGVQEADHKFAQPDDKNISQQILKCDVISTDDDSFRAGYAGRWLRDKFDKASRFEIDK